MGNKGVNLCLFSLELTHILVGSIKDERPLNMPIMNSPTPNVMIDLNLPNSSYYEGKKS